MDVVLTEAYRLADRSFRVSRFRIGSILSLVLMIAGVSLDFFIYPGLLKELLTIRILCDVATGLLLAASYTPFGSRNIASFGLAMVLIPNLAMSLMITISEGAMSPYYAGLNLVFVGVGVLMPWTVKETIGFCVITILVYIAACLIHGQTGLSWQTLFNNIYFLVLTAIICTTATFFTSRRRFEEFRLRHELDQRNQELARSNEQMEELDRLKSEFFANVSHELRTPITLIISPAPGNHVQTKPPPSYPGDPGHCPPEFHATDEVDQ